MAFSYDNWKKKNNNRKKPSLSVPSFDEFNSSRQKESTIKQSDTYVRSYEAYKYDEQGPKSEKAKKADADRFARGHKSEVPKSEKAKKADADRFAGNYLNQEAKRVERVRQTDDERFAKKYTTEQARLNHEALKSKSTISKPTDIPRLGQQEKQPTKKSDNASILSQILGSINDKDSYLNSSGVQINPLGNSLHNIGGQAESDTYKDTAKGFFMKDNVNDRLPEKAGANLRLGVGDTIESVAGGIRWITDKKSLLPNQKNFLADGVQSLADKTRSGFEDSAFQGEFEVSDWKNPEWLATQLPRAIPQLLTSIIPGMGAAAATGKISAIAKLSKLQRTIVQSIGGAGVTTAIDSTLEAGGVYDEALRRGMSLEEADSAAHETFNKNFLLTGGTTFGEFVLGLSPLGRKFNQINKVGQIGLRAGGGAVLEGLQEGAQEGISADALGDEFNWTDPSTIEAMLLGGILGGTVTGSMATYGEVKKSLTKEPRMDSPLTDILNSAIQDMPAEIRADLERSAANFRERQAELTEDESRQMAVEQLMQDVPEFQSVIEDATKRYVADKKQEAQSTELNPLTQEQNNLEEAQLEEMQSPTIEPTIDNTPSISPLDGQTPNIIQETVPEVQPLAQNDVQKLPKVEPGTNTPKQKTSLETPLEVQLGDKVNLEGTRSDSEYLVEGVEGDSVKVLTPNKVSIKVPKSKIVNVLNRQAEENAIPFEGEDFESSSIEALPPGEMVGDTQLPPNFRKDVQEILGEFVNDEGMTIDEAVNMVKTDEYYADNTEWLNLIDEEAAKHFGYQAKRKSGIVTNKLKTTVIAEIEENANTPKGYTSVRTLNRLRNGEIESGTQEFWKDEEVTHLGTDKEKFVPKAKSQEGKQEQKSGSGLQTIKTPMHLDDMPLYELTGRGGILRDLVNRREELENEKGSSTEKAILLAEYDADIKAVEKRIKELPQPVPIPLELQENEKVKWKVGDRVFIRGVMEGTILSIENGRATVHSRSEQTRVLPMRDGKGKRKTEYIPGGKSILPVSDLMKAPLPKKAPSFGEKFNVGDIVYNATKGGSAREYKITSKEDNQYTLQSTTDKKDKFFSPFGIPESDQHLYSDEAEAEKVATELRKQADKEHEKYIAGGKRPEKSEDEINKHIRYLPLDVIDDSRPLPKIKFKETDTRISATFIPNKGPWDNADPGEITLLFPKDKNDYLKLPKGKSVSDIHDLMNIDFTQEGVIAKQLIATFEFMNSTHSSEPKKAPVKKEDEQYVYIDDSRLKHPRLYKTEELQDAVENLSFDASGFDNKKTFNKYIKMLEKEWNSRLDEEVEEVKSPFNHQAIEEEIRKNFKFDPYDNKSIHALKMTGIGKYNYRDDSHREQLNRNEETVLSLMSDDEVKDYVAWNEIRNDWWTEFYKDDRVALKKEFMNHISTSGFGSLHWLSGGRASGDRFNKKQYEIIIGHKDNDRILYPSYNEMWGRYVKLLDAKGDTSNEVETNSDRPLETSGPTEIQRTENDGTTTEGSGKSKRGDGGRGSSDVPGNGPTESSTKSEGHTGHSSPSKHDDETSGRSEPSPNLRNPGRVKNNFSITDELDSFAGPKKRFQDNVKVLQLVKQLEDEGRHATPEEQSVLVRYVGWGGLASAFDGDNKTWTKEYAELNELVEDGTITQKEYEDARKSTQYAHYTSKVIIDSMYQAIENMGVKGGRVLEPGMGIGHFFGLMPTEWKSDLVGVEFDGLTGKIAKQLYQKANVEIKPYQDFKIADGYFDLVVGNPPFSDTTYDYNGKKLTLHNYFFVKSLDKLREGGILAFVTSSGTMNSKGAEARKRMGEKADFLGAIRLPSDAFKANAGTEVTTDIIFFQKRKEGAQPNHRGEFINTVERPITYQGNEVTVTENEYFNTNPDMVLGEITVDKLIVARAKPRLGVVTNGNFTEQLASAIEKLPKDIYEEATSKVEKVDYAEEISTNLRGLDEGNLAFDNGQLVQLSEGRFIKRTDFTGEKLNRIKGLINIRDAAKELLSLQVNTAEDTKIKVAMHKLNTLYDAFVKKYKTINNTGVQRPNISTMKSDPVGLSLLMSLEKEEKGQYVKHDIFKERVISYVPNITKVETSEEAMIVSLSQKGKIDLPYMAEVSGIDEDTLLKDLGARVYKNPVNNTWEVEDEYLSGNVRVKLSAVKEAVKNDESLQRNVKALEAVIPEDIESEDISVQFGAPWIPEQDYTDFINTFFQARNKKANVRFIRQTGDWKIEGKIDTATNLSEHAVASTRPGGQKLSGVDIINLTMNSKEPILKYKHDDNLVVDQEATSLARLKAKELQEEFEDWLFSDKDREKRLVRKYNDEFNAVVLQEYDGSLVYGGELKETSKPFMGGFNNGLYILRKHQKNVVWRMVQGGNTLLAHVVGAGKTLEMIVGGMEMKRLGMIKKPMYVVPNNLFEQWGREFREAYPNANILMLSNDLIPTVGAAKKYTKAPLKPRFDLSKLTDADKVSMKGSAKKYKVEQDKGATVMLRDSKGNLVNASRKDLDFIHTTESQKTFDDRVNEERATRGAALNRIAVGNYDAVILTHDTFKKLPMSPEYNQEFVREQLLDLEFALKEMKADNADKRTVKQLENAKEKLEKRLEKLMDADGKDIAIPFELLGVDQLFVDEAHKFKNLQFHTKLTGISGLSNTASQRSEDLYMKAKWLTKMRNGRGVVFATGTPISNTLAEMFTMQRYLQNNRLDELNIKHFDMWAKMFGQTETNTEMDVAGGYKQRTRFKRFKNIPELMTMFKEVTDIKTAPMLNLPRPKNVEFKTVVAPLSAQQKAYMEDIVNRAQDVQSGNVPKEEDNWLKITGDARKMSLDIRLANPSADEDTESKVNMAVENIAAIWKDGKKTRTDKEGKPLNNLTQLVFADLGTPKPKKQNEEGDEIEDDADDLEVISHDIYNDMKDKLIAQGIPVEEIAFIHDAKTPKKKEKLFKDMKAGKVRILFGSTEKMGAGMNVQDRLTAVHHIDAPWRPSDVEQREGRMIRQGNKLDDVTVYQYVTEGSFDRIMWDLLKNKASFIEQIMNGDASVREMEDVGVMELRFAHISAASTGDTTVIDKMNIDSTVKELRSAKEGHRKTIRKRKRTLAELPERIQYQKNEIAKVQKDIKVAPKLDGENFKIELGGKTYSKRTDAADALEKVFKKTKVELKKSGNSQTEKPIGKIGPFDLHLRSFFNGSVVGYKVTIHGENTYSSLYNEISPSGSLTRIENAINGLENTEASIQDELVRLQDEKENLTRTVTAPFKQESQLEEALQKQLELEKKMLALNKDENEQITDDGGNEDTFIGSRNSSSNSSNRNSDSETETIAATRPQIMRYIKDNFNVVIDYKKTRGKKGLYKNKFAIIRVKNYGDFEVLAHELGHRIDTKLKLSINKAINNELAEIAETNLEIPKSFNKIQKAREGAAEVFRQYLYGTQDFDNLSEEERDSVWTLDQMSEELDTFIREGLKEQGWDDKTVELQRLIRSWVNRSPQEEMAGVTSRFGENHKQKESLKRSWLRMYKWALDKDAPILAAQKLIEKDNGDKKLMNDKNAYGLAVGTRGSTARAVQFAEFGTFNTEFVKTNGEFVKTGEPLMDIFEDVEAIGDVDEFGQYLVAKHLYDLKTNKGKVKSPITISEETRKYIKEGDEKYGVLAERVYAFQNRMLEDILGANNMISQELIEQLQEEYKYYVPLARVKTDTGEKGGIVTSGASSGNSFANTQQGIKRMSKYGSTAMIINPMETIMKNIHLFMGIADKNAVGVAMASWADPNSEFATESAGQIIEKIPHDTSVTKVALSQMTDALLNAGLDTEIMESLDLDQFQNFYTSLFKPNHAKNEVLVWIDGKPNMYKIHDKIVYDALIDAESPMLSAFLSSPLTQIFTKPVDMVKYGITMTPFFTVQIFVRSYMQLMWKTEAKGANQFRYGKQVAKSMRDYSKKNEKYMEWMASGAAQSTFISSQQKYLQRSLDKVKLNKKAQHLLKRKPQSAKETMELVAYVSKKYLGYMPQKLQNFNDMLDSSLKMAEYEVMKKQTGNKLEAMKASREADMDYMRSGGAFMKGWNKLDPFNNIAWQGLDAMYRSFAAHKMRQGLRGLLLFGLPTFLLALMNYEDEEYWELNSYERDLNWQIPMGDGTFFRLRIPFEVGIVFKTLPEKVYFEIFDFISGQDKNNWDDFSKNIRNTILPAMVPFLFNLGFKYAFEKDWTNGREYVPMEYQGNSPAMQYNEDTSEIGKWLGSILDKSPFVIDETIKGLGAAWGSFILSTTDKTLDATGIVDRPNVKGLRRTYTEKYFSSSINDGSTDSLTTFYKKKQELESAYEDSGVKFDIPPELKAYRQANEDLKDLRKLRKDLTWNKLTKADGSSFTQVEKRAQIDTINKGLRDIARMVQGKKPIDQEELNKAWGMVDDYSLYMKEENKALRKKAKEKNK